MLIMERINNNIKEIMFRLEKLNSESFRSETKFSEKKEEINKITNLVHKLSDELKSKTEFIERNIERINNISDILIEFNQMLFTKKAPVSDGGDEIDAIAAGLNTLAEELEFSKQKEQTFLKKLEESEERFNKAFRLSPVGLTLTHVATGKWIEANDSFLNMIGYTHADVIGKTSAELGIISEEERKEMTNEIREKGSLKNKEMIFRRKTGETGIALFSNENITIRGEQVIITTVSDITKRKTAEAELKKKTEELARSNQELEQFAYVASHDLQEPLRMITSYVQLIEKKYKEKLDSEGVEFINYAVDGATRMQTLIYSLLDYSRINRVKPFEYVDLNETMAEVLQDLAISIRESNATVKYKKLPKIWCDKVLFGQLFFNLIGNAVKFRGKRKIVITVSASKGNAEGEYHFIVKDNGIGIKKEYREKIFVIFQRLHAMDKYPGTGIGLAICKKIVEKHNGKIWVESELNKGSEFHVVINTGNKKGSL